MAGGYGATGDRQTHERAKQKENAEEHHDNDGNDGWPSWERRVDPSGSEGGGVDDGDVPTGTAAGRTNGWRWRLFGSRQGKPNIPEPECLNCEPLT